MSNPQDQTQSNDAQPACTTLGPNDRALPDPRCHVEPAPIDPRTTLDEMEKAPENVSVWSPDWTPPPLSDFAVGGVVLFRPAGEKAWLKIPADGEEFEPLVRALVHLQKIGSPGSFRVSLAYEGGA